MTLSKHGPKHEASRAALADFLARADSLLDECATVRSEVTADLSGTPAGAALTAATAAGRAARADARSVRGTRKDPNP